jgi:hypothetical protein
MAIAWRGGDDVTRPGQPAPLAFSTGFGLLMAAAAAVHADAPGSIAAALAVLAVLVGLRYRTAATLSVLLVVAAIVLSNPPPLLAALSGLSAAAYLVIRHAAGSGVVTTTRPTVIGMVGFTLVGAIATMIPLSAPWLPLAAPLAIVSIFLLVTLPFVRDQRRNPVELLGRGPGGDQSSAAS